MKTDEYKSERSKLEAEAKSLIEEICASPSFGYWAKNQGLLEWDLKLKVNQMVVGAAELHWIRMNDYVWVPNPDGGDVVLQCSEAIERIKNFLSLFAKHTIPSFCDGIHKCDFFDNARLIAMHINNNSKVWQASKPTAPAKEPQQRELKDIVNIKEWSVSQLKNRIMQLIGGHKTDNAYIGAIFFRCRQLGYITDNPNDEEISRWFGEDVKVNRNYITPSKNKWETAIKKAQGIIINNENEHNERTEWEVWKEHHKTKPRKR